MTSEEVAKELEKRGIKIYIDACGCCQSPWYRIDIDGECVLDATVGNNDHLIAAEGFSSWELLNPRPPLILHGAEYEDTPEQDEAEKLGKFPDGKTESAEGTEYTEFIPPNAYRPGD